MKKYATNALAVFLLFTVSALAQAPSGPPSPGPEHKRLGYFLGKWVIEGEDKPGPWGPGGKFTSTETTEWFPGGFFLVTQADMKTPMGPAKSRSMMGYNKEEKSYTFHMIDSMGTEVSARGQLSGNTWIWTNEMKMGGQNHKGRFTIKEESPTSYTMKLEFSTNGGPYVVVSEAKATKK